MGVVLEIFTNAPRALDHGSSAPAGGFCALRIVSVKGSRRLAEAQLRRYKDRGFFATTNRRAAVDYVTQKATFEPPGGAEYYLRLIENGSFEVD